MKRLLYILFLASVPLTLFSKNKYSAEDSVRISKLLETAQSYTDRAHYDSAKQLCRQIVSLAKFKEFKRGECYAYTQLADIGYQEGDYAGLKLNDSMALDIAEQIADTGLLATAYELQGLYQMDKGSKSLATDAFNTALRLQYEAEQSSNTARIYVNLGLLNSNNKDVATKWFLKGIKLYEKAKDDLGLSNAYNNYSTHLVSLERTTEALEYAKKALRLREKIKDDYGLMYSYANISQIYTMLDSIKTAIYYQQQSVEKAEEIGSNKLRAQSYIGMSLLYSRLKRQQPAFEYELKVVKLLEQDGNTEMLSRRYIALAMAYEGMKQPELAVSYYNKAIEMAQEHDYKENLRDAYLYTAIFYKNKKDFYNAYEYLKKYYKVRDELIDEETVTTIAELETKYETQKKEERIKQLSNEKLIQQLKLQRQALFRNLLIGGILVLLVIAYILFNRYQLKKKLEQKTALLKERSRISAELHDEVGSTLSTINILSHSARMKLNNDVEKSGSLLEKINENSQRMMDAMSDIVWSINPENDELGNISVRMKEFASEILDNKNIDYTFKISDSLLNVKLSPAIRKDLYLVFKEAINNLAKYSLAKEASISLERVNGNILMEIRDKGIGFDMEKLRSGSGTNNMKVRTEGHGGVFKISSKEGAGTSISVSIPIA